MSEATVDVNSKTSLFKRWLVLMQGDFAKGAAGYTSVLNWAFMALAVWQVIGPIYEARGGSDQANLLGKMQEANQTLASDVAHWKSVAESNVNANDIAMKQKADQAAKIAELEGKLQAALGGEGQKQPIQRASLAAEPPVNNVKVRKAPIKPKADPTLYEQLVAWYEANVGAAN